MLLCSAVTGDFNPERRHPMRQHVEIPTLFLILVALTTGCGNIKTTSYLSPPAVRLGNYSGLEIPNFESKIPDVPEDALKEIPKEVAKALKDKKVGFKDVVTGDEELPYEKGALVMFGEITDYRSATDLRAEGGGIKFGESSITVSLTLLDKATGQEVASGEVSSTNTLGLVSKGVYGSIADEVAKFLKENY
jgi:hypothetical protein